jgi:CHAT domain-containing protein
MRYVSQIHFNLISELIDQQFDPNPFFWGAFAMVGNPGK